MNKIANTTNSHGVHDTFRFGTTSIESSLSPAHPLENRLKNVCRMNR
jgi:hypothetical protein